MWKRKSERRLNKAGNGGRASSSVLALVHPSSGARLSSFRLRWCADAAVGAPSRYPLVQQGRDEGTTWQFRLIPVWHCSDRIRRGRVSDQESIVVSDELVFDKRGVARSLDRSRRRRPTLPVPATLAPLRTRRTPSLARLAPPSPPSRPPPRTRFFRVNEPSVEPSFDLVRPRHRALLLCFKLSGRLKSSFVT